MMHSFLRLLGSITSWTKFPLVRAMAIASALLLAMTTSSARAQSTDTFTGGAGTSLTLSGNWTGGTPSAGQSWWISTTSNTLTYDFDSATFPGFWTNGITFGPTSGAITINGGAGNNTMTLGGNILNLSASTDTISANIALTSSLVVNNLGAGNFAITGIISGTGLGLSKQGIGTLTLSNANLYTGATTVASGTLALQFSATTLSNIVNSGSALALTGGTLQLLGSGANTQQFNGVTYSGGSSTISYTAGTSMTLTLGSLTHGTGGTLNFNNLAGAGYTVTTSNGAANLTAGIMGGGVFAGLNDFAAIVSGKVATYTGYQNVVAQGSWVANTVISSSAALTGSIQGNLTIAGFKFGSATSTGMSLNGHILTINDGAGVGGIIINSVEAAKVLTISSGVAGAGLTAGTTAGGELVILNNGGTTTGLTVNVPIGDNGAGVVDVVYAGGPSTTGATTFAGVNTYSGGTFINGGTLIILADTGLGATTGGVTFSGNSVLQIVTNTTTLNSSRTININSGATASFNTAASTTVAGVIQGAGSLTKAGASTLLLTGANQFTGNATIAAGTLVLGNAGALNSTTLNTVTLSTSGAALDVNGFSVSVSGLSGVAGTSVVNNGGSAATLSINNAGAFTEAGVIANGTNVLGLAVYGTGTMTLSGTTNTYSGGTTIAGGTLVVTGTDGALALRPATSPLPATRLCDSAPRASRGAPIARSASAPDSRPRSIRTLLRPPGRALSPVLARWPKVLQLLRAL